MKEKEYVNPPNVRAILAQVRKEQRIRKKVRAAQVVQAEAALTCQTPKSFIQTKEVSCING